jgi:aspartyl-tRNA(Asn)/glutamyl-tRNA(Gln) amidotransferase subunit A
MAAIDPALSTLTIAEASRRLRDGSVTSVDLTQSCIDRIEAVDSQLNAVVCKTFERALEQAKKIDASTDKNGSPLAGIPYLNKDVFCEEGVPSTVASNVLRGGLHGKDYVPPFDSTTTRKLKEAGAISLGHANTDEFVMGSSTESSCYGTSKNPWDTTRVPGGSSGGSAAGVAADEAIFATGTDTGGSIRQPAALTGTTGLKVTYGRVSRYGVIAMTSSLDTIGPICKTAEDCAIVLEAIAGKDTLDATTPDVAVPSYSNLLEGSLKGMKIGIPTEYFAEGLHPEVAASVKDAVKAYEDMGATVVDVSLPHTKYGVATYYVLCPCEVSSNLARYDGVRYGASDKTPESLVDYYERVRSGGFGAEVKRRIMIGTHALSAGYYDAYYRQAQKIRTLVLQDFTEAFKKVDLLLTPTTPNPAFTIGSKTNDPVTMYMEDVCTIPASLAGVPALSLPCGFTKDGLPIGLQIIGPAFEETKVLMAGHQYQKQTDWHSRRAPL